ncbi:hypothetical protein OESDEN_14139 [Oesophagostomum dentatum]|uniref:Uncharacterized protein n=1 Tax=Oesophagostomum dentatum TaxID=61180 RepID=A0A0B1SMH8_OESDE|nr:hypothetical protein OESDEN_14139 [Oesophagostomum dentatum]
MITLWIKQRLLLNPYKRSKVMRMLGNLLSSSATIQDGDASETRQTAIEVLGAVEEFHRLLPVRIFEAFIRSSGKGIGVDESHSHKACLDMLSRWKSYTRFNSNSVWDQVYHTLANKITPLMRFCLQSLFFPVH